MSNRQPISTFLGIAAAVLLATSSSGFGVNPCPEDTNGDGSVNVLDLIELLLCFGQPAVPGCEPADITQDGAVDVLDLIELLLHFGELCFACDLQGAPGATCHAENNTNASNINPSSFRAADDFTPLADSSVTSGCVWLITLDGGTVHDLTVTYYDNDPATNLPDESGGMGVGIAGPFSQSGGTLTVTGPTFVGNNLPVGKYQEFKFEHAGVAIIGGQCYWVEITDTTPTSSAFWEFGFGGNTRAVQDGVGGLNGYDAADVTAHDHRYCLDIVWDVSDCAAFVPPPPPPVNNACAARIPLLNGLTAISTLSATTDGIATNGTPVRRLLDARGLRDQPRGRSLPLRAERAAEKKPAFNRRGLL